MKEIEKITGKSFLPIIEPHKGQVLVEVVREIKPKRVLEVGTLIGYSATLMGKELGKDTEIITIEIIVNDARKAEENIKRGKIFPTMKVIFGNALEVITGLESVFDLVFIDAEKSECVDYLRLVEDKLHRERVIVADNAGIFVDEMRNYLDYVRFSGK
ncbi:MAG: class I SAM-dependent methyltransferase [Candidatus Bathyarchaeota archaeon]